MITGRTGRSRLETTVFFEIGRRCATVFVWAQSGYDKNKNDVFRRSFAADCPAYWTSEYYPRRDGDSDPPSLM